MNIRANATFRAGDSARLEALLVPKLIKGAGDAAAAVLADSQAIAPVRSGDLRTSGRTSTEWVGKRVNGYVVYTAPHAAFVEFGTGVIGRGTYPYSLPQQGTPITGAWVYDYKSQNWPGMVAQPYIRPAMDGARQKCVDAFRAALSV